MKSLTLHCTDDSNDTLTITLVDPSLVELALDTTSTGNAQRTVGRQDLQRFLEVSLIEAESFGSTTRDFLDTGIWVRYRHDRWCISCYGDDGATVAIFLVSLDAILNFLAT